MGCMICGAPAVVVVDAPVTLNGYDAPAGRKAYEPLEIRLCQRHLDDYHRG